MIFTSTEGVACISCIKRREIEVWSRSTTATGIFSATPPSMSVMKKNIDTITAPTDEVRYSGRERIILTSLISTFQILMKISFNLHRTLLFSHHDCSHARTHTVNMRHRTTFDIERTNVITAVLTGGTPSRIRSHRFDMGHDHGEAFFFS